MVIKKLEYILIINCLLFFHFGFGFNGNVGRYLQSFMRFNDVIEDQKFFLPMEDDSLENFNFFKSFEISSEEKMIIEHGQASLAILEKKHDCFKEATMALKNGCKDIDLSNNDKMQYAVRLTKCELATANLAFPMECDGFDHNIGKCIESISRTPQFWTTYSGYFREVSQMCFAMRYSLERDLLEEFNRNITFKYYDILKNLQEIMKNLRNEETNRLMQIKQFLINLAKDINELEKMTSYNTGSLKGILTDFQLTSQSALNQITHLDEELGKFIPNTKIILDEINNSNEQQLSTVKELTAKSKDIIRINFEKLGQIYQHLQKINNVAQDTLSSQEQIYENIEDIKNQHRELVETVQEVKQNLRNLLNIEIQELAESAKNIQQGFIGIFKPIEVLLVFINSIFDGKAFAESSKESVVFGFLLLAVIFWKSHSKIMTIATIAVTIRLLNHYANQYESEQVIQSFVLMMIGGILSRLFSNAYETQMITKLLNILRRR
ncbi:hypothetical protein C1645_878771 [Glomus cerebriforme]|uniref:Nuclear fusion protein KAR5 n=1 Tax=Glomus cerebriforme TaxID=658196 RepID=A0A397SJ67_9GLOM|nr:hypothetical protein C1645_878771 [Glomus cerebriforme]